MSKFTKVVSTLLVVAAVATFVVPAKAQTADELKAQVAQLQAALAALTAQLGGTATTPATSAYTFTKNLTVGSKGAEVSALQDFLASKGFLTATARGYFGLLTKAALAKYQASVGITPAAGYFGAITRAQINASQATTTPTVSPSPVASTTPAANGQITTPGVEAEMTAEVNSTPSNNVTVREGDQKVSVMGLKLRAKKGDVLVQRIKLDLGTSTRIYNRVATNLYFTDEAGNVIASSALNSGTVTKDGSNYFATLSGFNFLVKKDETKNVFVKFDVNGSIDSTDRHSWTIKLPVHGIRYTDGANVISYAPSSELSRSYTLAVSEAEQATASFSKSANTPRSTALVSDSTDNKIEKATILAVSVKAEKGDVKVTDLTVTSSGSVTPAAVYLYDGSTEVDSASASGTTFTFALADSDYITVAKDATKTLTIKADYSNITATATPSTSTLALTSMVGENALGDSLTVTGSNVVSDAMYLSAVSPVVTLANAPTAVYTAPSFSNSTGTMKTTFSVQIKAEGNDVYIPKTSAFTVADVTSGTSTTTNVAVDYQKPGSITELTNTYKLAKGETYTFDVNVSLPTAGKTGFHYFSVTDIKWDTTDTASATGDVNYLGDILKTNSVSITNG